MARYELKLPQMGESVEEATVSSWLKKVGDTIHLDDILVEVATDKVDSEIPSDVEGILTEILTGKNRGKGRTAHGGDRNNRAKCRIGAYYCPA